MYIYARNMNKACKVVLTRRQEWREEHGGNEADHKGFKYGRDNDNSANPRELELPWELNRVYTSRSRS